MNFNTFIWQSLEVIVVNPTFYKYSPFQLYLFRPLITRPVSAEIPVAEAEADIVFKEAEKAVEDEEAERIVRRPGEVR